MGQNDTRGCVWGEQPHCPRRGVEYEFFFFLCFVPLAIPGTCVCTIYVILQNFKFSYLLDIALLIPFNGARGLIGSPCFFLKKEVYFLFKLYYSREVGSISNTTIN